jgi:hypothetical protein
MTHRPHPPKQLSFASYEFGQKKRVMRREKFLAEMEQVVPWAWLEALIEPLYPTGGPVGHQPIGVPRMLRMSFLQQWFGLADEALEDAIYDSQSMREFIDIDIDLARESVPDAKTLLKFRRLLEQHQLTAKLFEGINAHLTERGRAQVRARVEHPFHVVKNLFHYGKVRYKGLAKNKAQLYSLFGLANLVIAEKRLLDAAPLGVSAP